MAEMLFIVNVSVANVYEHPRMRSAVTTQALLGESCFILDREDRWIRIRQWDGYEGWIVASAGIESSVVYPSNWIMRDLYGQVLDSDGVILRKIVFGDELKATSNGEGYTVILPDGQSGWTPAKLEQSFPSPGRDALIKRARTFLGTPYCWGGKSPYGFDCSGFVQTVFKAFGISLPRDSHEQARFLENNPVDPSNAQSGDLFFFTEEDQVTHVALSTGGEGFIHAQGWVKEESLAREDPRYNSALKEKLVLSTSISELLEP